MLRRILLIAKNTIKLAMMIIAHSDRVGIEAGGISWDVQVTAPPTLAPEVLVSLTLDVHESGAPAGDVVMVLQQFL